MTKVGANPRVSNAAQETPYAMILGGDANPTFSTIVVWAQVCEPEGGSRGWSCFDDICQKNFCQ
ncbi:hypothetical protein PISMIDRAFT_672923 [Pisolithus microcarpus 441]|uniref:Uncharacterized protein n=1 Tax=Pisolithus microcarpus 441 TaxID=765257 RepID=A0A0D0A2R6_9AGAM|nr:hypothetical protein PISMIDRAFT_672923 [Pisolithus microcarpus 441]